MSQERVERVRALMPADGTDLRDVFVKSGALSGGGLVADDAVVRFVAPHASVSGTGPEGFRARWTDWLEPWESYLIYTDDVVDRDDRVVVLTRLRGVTRRDRVEMEHDAAAVFRFEGDTVVEIEFILDRQAALGE
jgi:ketosteroid isomerase-like protein